MPYRTKEEIQRYVNDHFDTMARIFERKYCIRLHMVKKWLRWKGYTEKDFGKVLNEFENNLPKILNEMYNLAGR